MIENPMVLDSYWRDRERSPEIYGECAGCGEFINEGEEYYEFDIENMTYKIHEKSACCRDFISDISIIRTAGE